MSGDFQAGLEYSRTVPPSPSATASMGRPPSMEPLRGRGALSLLPAELFAFLPGIFRSFFLGIILVFSWDFPRILQGFHRIFVGFSYFAVLPRTAWRFPGPGALSAATSYQPVPRAPPGGRGQGEQAPPGSGQGIGQTRADRPPLAPAPPPKGES